MIATAGPNIPPEDFIAGWWRLRHRGDGAWGMITVSGQGVQHDHVPGSNGHGNPINLLNNAGVDAYIRLGHDRYATSGGAGSENSQPIYLSDGQNTLGLAHNGNLPGKVVQHLRTLLRTPLPDDASDSRVMAQLLLDFRPRFTTWEETFVALLPRFQGAFSLACLTDEDAIYAIRDPWDIRPLCLGRKNNTWVVASESVALDSMGATYMREVEPGEIVCLRPDGRITATKYASGAGERRCALEPLYFSKIDSIVDQETIREQRQRLGELVGARFLNKGKREGFVVPILNSGKQVAIGVARALGLPIAEEAIRLALDKRSFIQNTPATRTEVVNQKHVVNGEYIRGKCIILCDDSLVRGTSLIALLAKIREHNPAEIHILLGSEPVIDICEWGVDLPTRTELFVYNLLQERPDWSNQDEYLSWLAKVEDLVAKELGVDSVTYLDRKSVNLALNRTDDQLCRHCFGGKKPTEDNPPTYRIELDI